MFRQNQVHQYEFRINGARPTFGRQGIIPDRHQVPEIKRIYTSHLYEGLNPLQNNDVFRALLENDPYTSKWNGPMDPNERLSLMSTIRIGALPSPFLHWNEIVKRAPALAKFTRLRNWFYKNCTGQLAHVTKYDKNGNPLPVERRTFTCNICKLHVGGFPVRLHQCKGCPFGELPYEAFNQFKALNSASECGFCGRESISHTLSRDPQSECRPQPCSTCHREGHQTSSKFCDLDNGDPLSFARAASAHRHDHYVRVKELAQTGTLRYRLQNDFPDERIRNKPQEQLIRSGNYVKGWHPQPRLGTIPDNMYARPYGYSSLIVPSLDQPAYPTRYIIQDPKVFVAIERALRRATKSSEYIEEVIQPFNRHHFHRVFIPVEADHRRDDRPIQNLIQPAEPVRATPARQVPALQAPNAPVANPDDNDSESPDDKESSKKWEESKKKVMEKQMKNRKKQGDKKVEKLREQAETLRTSKKAEQEKAIAERENLQKKLTDLMKTNEEWSNKYRNLSLLSSEKDLTIQKLQRELAAAREPSVEMRRVLADFQDQLHNSDKLVSDTQAKFIRLINLPTSESVKQRARDEEALFLHKHAEWEQAIKKNIAIIQGNVHVTQEDLVPVPETPGLSKMLENELVIAEKENESLGKACLVCLDEKSQRQNLFKCPHCPTTFHLKCIINWIKSGPNNQCPSCKKNLNC